MILITNSNRMVTVAGSSGVDFVCLNSAAAQATAQHQVGFAGLGAPVVVAFGAARAVRVISASFWLLHGPLANGSLLLWPPLLGCLC